MCVRGGLPSTAIAAPRRLTGRDPAHKAFDGNGGPARRFPPRSGDVARPYGGVSSPIVTVNGLEVTVPGSAHFAAPRHVWTW